MRVLEYRLKNFKGIAELSTKLPSEPIALSLIYAPNGQGKTTFLEGLSLIGHLPCMTRLRWGAPARPSWYSQRVGEAVVAPTPHLPASSTPEGLWSHNMDHRYAMASFFLEDFVGGENSSKERLRITVIIDVKVYSVSKLLSGGLTDLDFGRYATVIYDERNEAEVDRLIERLARGRTFSRKKGIHEAFPGKPSDIRRFVTYVNTDLNDFGRGNDLRESPKDFTGEEFIEQMQGRLALPFSEEGGDLTFDDDLKVSVSEILKTTPYKFTADVVVPEFKIRRFAIDSGNLIFRATRFGESEYLDVSNLSAGENEVLFVMLMMLKHKGEHGIILLDEPDLHVARARRGLLFGEIFKSYNTKTQQLLIISHSEPALRSMKNYKFESNSRRRRVKVKDHLRILMEVRDEGLTPPRRTVLNYDKGYHVTVMSGLLDGVYGWLGRIPVYSYNIGSIWDRYVTASKKANLWVLIVGNVIALLVAVCGFTLLKFIAPPFDSAKGTDTIHDEWLERFMFAAIIGGATLVFQHLMLFFVWLTRRLHPT
jgi:predicted ATPase